MRKEPRTYFCGQTKHQGLFVYPDGPAEKRPAVIIAHAWMGQDDFARKKAEELAELGYIAFAADIYGDGIEVNTPQEAQKLMLPLFFDRKILQQRILAAFEEVNQNPAVDSKNIGAIGFCFGGLTVIELLRSGAPVKAVVSFHGVLGNAMGEHKAHTVPIASDIKGSLLILHGYQDPLVSQEDSVRLQKELNDAGVDWQMDVYGHTYHAFTNPQAHDEKSGLVYNAKTATRAWRAMRLFFEEIFSPRS